MFLWFLRAKKKSLYILENREFIYQYRVQSTHYIIFMKYDIKMLEANFGDRYKIDSQSDFSHPPKRKIEVITFSCLVFFLFSLLQCSISSNVNGSNSKIKRLKKKNVVFYWIKRNVKRSMDWIPLTTEWEIFSCLYWIEWGKVKLILFFIKHLKSIFE